MNTISKISGVALMMVILLSCQKKKNDEQLQREAKSLDLTRGEITLCSSGEGQFGIVEFGLACSDKVKEDFNLATALLHSFEYSEAEKMFARVIDNDPTCVMAYWGAAMCSFHPLWEAPSQDDLRKGAKIVTLARTLIEDRSSKESAYLEAIATIYDDWQTVDHRTRLLKFEDASKKVFEKYPDDKEAAIFYSLALRAAADPADKSFAKQKQAGEILNQIFVKEPNHPGIAHYIIHTYDYPELAPMALPAARKYAAIASASAHAQHMPSHIFTRLGLWDECIQSNINSMAAAQCYAKSQGIKGHWDEELHGMDYLVYAYLQKADDKKAEEQIEYFKTMHDVFPVNFKDAYSFAAMPTRYAVERRDWKQAAELELTPAEFPWDKFPWEKANLKFGKALGAAHIGNLKAAREALEELQAIHKKLDEAKEKYRANLVLIQVKLSEGWIKFAEGRRQDAVMLLTEAADMEDATEKHPVTPGEIVPARELLGDLYMAMNEPAKALEAYEASLKKHPNRFNGLYGAGKAAKKLHDEGKVTSYLGKLISISDPASSRPELQEARSLVKNNI